MPPPRNFKADIKEPLRTTTNKFNSLNVVVSSHSEVRTVLLHWQNKAEINLLKWLIIEMILVFTLVTSPDPRPPGKLWAFNSLLLISLPWHVPLIYCGFSAVTTAEVPTGAFIQLLFCKKNPHLRREELAICSDSRYSDHFAVSQSHLFTSHHSVWICCIFRLVLPSVSSSSVNVFPPSFWYATFLFSQGCYGDVFTYRVLPPVLFFFFPLFPFLLSFIFCFRLAANSIQMDAAIVFPLGLWWWSCRVFTGCLPLWKCKGVGGIWQRTGRYLFSFLFSPWCGLIYSVPTFSSAVIFSHYFYFVLIRLLLSSSPHLSFSLLSCFYPSLPVCLPQLIHPPTYHQLSLAVRTEVCVRVCFIRVCAQWSGTQGLVWSYPCICQGFVGAARRCTTRRAQNEEKGGRNAIGGSARRLGKEGNPA